MRATEARLAVVDWLERQGWVVYDRRRDAGLPAMGQLVITDPNSGGHLLVRVMTGKRPKDSDRMFIDRRREGLADVLALVDPRDGSVRLQMPSSLAEAPATA